MAGQRLGEAEAGVVSAVSGDSKEAGTTSQLLQAFVLACGGRDEYRTALDEIYHSHMELALDDGVGTYRTEVSKEIADLQRICGSVRAVASYDVGCAGSASAPAQRESHAMMLDQVLGSGERLAAHALCAKLAEQGVAAKIVDLSHRCEQPDATLQPALFERQLQKALCPFLSSEPLSHVVPVVTGFFGPVTGGLLASLGRGYTDFTAAACASAVKALKLQVWKETGGVFTAHPRIVPEARLLTTVSMDEAQELTYFGNAVLHAGAVPFLRAQRIPAEVKHTQAREMPGTWIYWDDDNVGFDFMEPALPVTAVCSMGPVDVLDICSTHNQSAAVFLAQIFSAFAEVGVAPELVSTSVRNVSVVLGAGTSDTERDTLTRCLKPDAHVSVRAGRGVVSCVGERMASCVGLAAEACDVLAQKNISIEMLSQSCAENNMSFVVPNDSLTVAVRALHQHFCEAPLLKTTYQVPLL